MQSHKPKYREEQPKVLTVGPSLSGGGGIAAVLGMYRGFVPGFTFLPTNSPRGSVAGAFVLAATLLQMPLMRMRGYRILHAHGASGKSYIRKSIVMRWARLLGMRTVFHCHGGSFAEYSRKTGTDKIRRQLAKCDAVVAITDAALAFFRDELHLPRVVKINNPLPEMSCTRGDFGSTPPSKPLRMVFLGKICRDKGIYDLLEAIALPETALKGRVHLTIGGLGEDDKLRQRIATLGLRNDVDYRGFVGGTAKDELIAGSDLMVLPSYVECMPITLLEAQHAGVPVVSTPVGDIPNLVRNGYNGTLIPAGNVGELAKAIARYADNPTLLAEQASHAAEMTAPYRPENIAGILNDLYYELDK